jgi:hypothetical protein
VGRNSIVGIATGYGFECPEIESPWERDFPHPSRLGMGPTQPSVQWVPVVQRPVSGLNNPPASSAKVKVCMATANEMVRR